MQILDKPCTHFRRDRVGDPWMIVLHYSATFTAAATYSALESRKVSAHGTIDLNGDLWDHVGPEHTAWHAGEGTWAGSVNVNDDSLGYEIANVGYGSPIPSGTDTKGWYIASSQKGRTLTAYRKESYKDTQGAQKTTYVGIAEPMAVYPDHRSEHKGRLWAAYTPQQIATLLEIQRRDVDRFGILPEMIIGHEHASPGRKSDPGPAFRPVWEALAADYKAFVAERQRERLLDPSYLPELRWKAVQSHLKRLGVYRLRIDGDPGNGTKAGIADALKAFGSTYQLPDLSMSTPTWDICNALRLVPGFSPPR